MVEGIIKYLDDLKQVHIKEIEAIDQDLRVKLFYFQNSKFDLTQISQFSDQIKYIFYLSFLQNFTLSQGYGFKEFIAIFDIVVNHAINNQGADGIQPCLYEVLEQNLKLYIFKIELKDVEYTRLQIEKYRDKIKFGDIVTHYCIRVIGVFDNLIKEQGSTNYKVMLKETPEIFKLLNQEKNFRWFYIHLKISFERLRIKLGETLNEIADHSKLDAKYKIILRYRENIQYLECELNRLIDLPLQEKINPSGSAT